MFFTFLTHMSNFMLIGYYLLFDLTYFLCIILDYKNLKFWLMHIAIDFLFSRKFASMEDIRKCNIMVNFLKFTSNKEILGVVVALCYNQVWCPNLS